MQVFFPGYRSASGCLRHKPQLVTLFPHYTKRALLSHTNLLPQPAPCSNEGLDGASVQSLMLHDTCSLKSVFPAFNQGAGAIPPPWTSKKTSAFIASRVTPRAAILKCVCNIYLTADCECSKTQQSHFAAVTPGRYWHVCVR